MSHQPSKKLSRRYALKVTGVAAGSSMMASLTYSPADVELAIP